MAKRFIDTSFYKSPFVRGLKGSLKSLYCFIICDCDGAGIWNYDLQIASTYIGFEVKEVEFLKSFVETKKAIYLKNGRYFFPDFIEHQYPKGLSINNPAQKNFIIELQKNLLIDSDLKPLWSTFKGTKVMVMEKGEVKATEKEKVIPGENEFLEHCKVVCQDKYQSLEFSLKSKYQTWVDDGWKTGHNKPIKNWKNTINNTIPFLKPINNGTKQSDTSDRKQSVSNLKKLSEAILDDYAAKNGGGGV